MSTTPQFNFRDNIAPLFRGGSGDYQRDTRNAAEALKLTHDWLDTLRSEIDAVKASVAAIAPSVPRLVLHLIPLVVANTAIGFPSEPANTVHLYMLKQDAAGSRTVTWPLGFKSALQPEVTADSVSSQWFYKDSETLVYPVGAYLGGISIL